MKPVTIIFLFFVIFCACNKQADPIPESGQQAAVFYLKGMFDGKPLLIAAGENDVFMNTYDTVYQATPNLFISRFSGEFGKLNCRRCAGNFLFVINDFKFSSTNLVHFFDSVVNNGNVLSFAKPGSPTTGRIIIDYFDENGLIYTTETNRQPNSNKFTITSVEEYLVNQYGQKTKKIKAYFSCKLYNISIGDSIEFNKAEVVLALSRR